MAEESGGFGAERIKTLLKPYLEGEDLTERACDQLSVYLALIVKWNARTNLTAIRDPAEIIRVHFGESVFLARHLGSCAALLDFGSGAGLPGIPIKIVRPEITVTLAESQGKKAAFLREAVRTLDLKAEVWSNRVERMALGREFETIALRAVDGMELAISEAARRATDRLVVFGVAGKSHDVEALASNFAVVRTLVLPESTERVAFICERRNVPRGTAFGE